MTGCNHPAPKPQKATFVVQVQFQQNATWQGTISWTDEKKTQYFRSELELLRLMDDALRTGREDEFPGWDDEQDKQDEKERTQ